MPLLKLYLMTGAVLLVVETTWLGFFAGDLFRQEVGHLMRADFLLKPAAAFYLIYVAGILVFAVLPGLQAEEISKTLRLGAFLGLLAYGTFDLTSMALFKDFPLKVALVDMAWGTLMTGGVSGAAYGIARWLEIGG